MTEFELVLRELSGIRTALERIAAAIDLATTVPPAPTGCEHPAEKRIDFGVTNGVEDWECGLCHYRPPIPAAV